MENSEKLDKMINKHLKKTCIIKNWTLVGHMGNESRFGSAFNIVEEKSTRALDQGISVVFCCGESLEDR